MALAGPATRRRYTDAECVCVVEDALVGYKLKNLIAVMEDQYSLVQEILRTERLTPDRRETADLNAVRYGKAQAEILEWVRNEGGKYGLELQDRDEQEGAAGPR